MESQRYETLYEQISEYLIKKVEEGSPFVKSRHVASDLNLSVKRVGKLMASIERDDPQFDVERWGGSSDGVTWYVQLNTTTV